MPKSGGESMVFLLIGLTVGYLLSPIISIMGEIAVTSFKNAFSV